MQQNIRIDENILTDTISNINKHEELIKLSMNNYDVYGLASYDYCTQGEDYTDYYFLGYMVNKLAIKVDNNEMVKEVLLKVKTFDLEKFYQKVIDSYGMPSTMSLSKFYLEKKGFQIPTEIERDSLNEYYSEIPQPKLNEFPEVQSLTWYNVKNGDMADMQIKNKTHPSEIFTEKEVWIVFKRAK